MKNVILAATIFIVILIAMTFSISYLNKVSLNLQNINDEIEQYVTDNKWDEAYKTSMGYTQKWEKNSKAIKLFVNHQEIDNIEIELWKLPQYIKEHTKDESLASVHVLKFLVDHISKLEKVNIQNVF
jgi:hypothetical protein